MVRYEYLTLDLNGDLLKLTVSEGKHGRRVTISKRKRLNSMRKAFKHCLIAMRQKFGHLASRARVSKRPN